MQCCRYVLDLAGVIGLQPHNRYIPGSSSTLQHWAIMHFPNMNSILTVP